jgi:signal transduction histidine kinase
MTGRQPPSTHYGPVWRIQEPSASSDTPKVSTLAPLESAPLRLLVVEDSPSDAMMLVVALHESVLHSATIISEPCLSAALKRLRDGTFDGVLVDLGLPDSEGLETFVRVREAAGGAAIVVITGRDDAQLAEEAVRLGAQDYLLKAESRPGETGRAVDYAVRRRRVLRDLEQARDDQLDAKDRFLSHVSHELRSPLAVVHQFGSLLRDSVAGPMSPDQQQLMAVLMRNVGQLKLMIDDLLDVSRSAHGRLMVEAAPLDLRVLLADALAAYGPAADHQNIRLGLDPGTEHLPMVVGDAGRLREVLINVVDNALKFTPAGGRITLRAVVDCDCVRVTVRDTGCGIPPEYLDRVFEQFFQVQQSDEAARNGLGLGLFVCRDLIQRQGGVMWAESVLEHGSDFSFTIPILSSTNDPEAMV